MKIAMICNHQISQIKVKLNQITADNRAKAEQCGAIDVILNVLKVHIDNAVICSAGCGALMNISLNGIFIE